MKGSTGNKIILRNAQKKTNENRGQEIHEQRRKQNPGKKYTTMNVRVKRKNA